MSEKGKGSRMQGRIILSWARYSKNLWHQLFEKTEHSLFPKTNKCKLPNSI